MTEARFVKHQGASVDFSIVDRSLFKTMNYNHYNPMYCLDKNDFSGFHAICRVILGRDLTLHEMPQARDLLNEVYRDYPNPTLQDLLIYLVCVRGKRTVLGKACFNVSWNYREVFNNGNLYAFFSDSGGGNFENLYYSSLCGGERR